MEINFDAIRTICKQKSFSQEYIAHVLGLSQAQYSRLENGSMVFRVDVLARLLEILDVNPLDVLVFSPNQMKLIAQSLSIENIIEERLEKLNLFPLMKKEMKDIDGGYKAISYDLLRHRSILQMNN